ncbi:MAG: hypothetical protein FWE87_00665 [Coriobacteriia bacterium]|nr:hypothetical protein [Coriobacteriia bacterium]
MNENYTEEEVIDMVEEPGSNTWSSSAKPGSNIAADSKVSLFGGSGGNKLPLIIGGIILALLLCCVFSSMRGCGSLFNNTTTTSSTTQNNDTGGLLGGLLGGDSTNKVDKTEYQARIGQSFTIGGVTFLLQQGTEDNSDFGGTVEAFQAMVQNHSDQPLTIYNDRGWTALDVNGNYLEYDWYSEALGNSNTDIGTIDTGDTYSIVLIFTDGNYNPASANVIKADLSRPLDGYTSIVWSN